MKWKGFSITAIGSRQMNQDSLCVQDDSGIYAVADGVGGGLRGEVASLMAVTGIAAHPEENTLKQTVELIQEAIYREAMESIGEALMGTTLTALYLKGEAAEMAHVGDSHCYRFQKGVLQQLTVDHELYDEEAHASVLASYLGIPTDLHPLQIQCETLPLVAGEHFLLCSDGLYKQVPEWKIAQIMTEKLDTPDEMLKTLVEEAIQASSSDNITIVFIQITE